MPSEITGLLNDWRSGDPTALDSLAPLIEAELRRLAHFYMGKERPGHILETTALVNEAYLRLVQQKTPWQNRAHFFGIAASMMRRILCNYARDQRRLRRGGGALQVSLSDLPLASHPRLEEVLAVDEALRALAEVTPNGERMSRMVELRFFGGLRVEEMAEVLGVSTSTVNLDWKFAKGWLARRIGGAAAGDA